MLEYLTKSANTFALLPHTGGVRYADELVLAALFGGLRGHLRGSPQGRSGPHGGKRGARSRGLDLVPAP